MTQNDPNAYRLTAAPSALYKDRACFLFRGETLVDGRIGMDAAVRVCDIVNKGWLPGYLASIPTLPASEREDIIDAYATLLPGQDGKHDLTVLGRRMIQGMKKETGEFLMEVLNASLLAAGRESARIEQARRTIDVEATPQQHAVSQANASRDLMPSDTAPSRAQPGDGAVPYASAPRALVPAGQSSASDRTARNVATPATSTTTSCGAPPHDFSSLAQVAVATLGETMNQEAVRRTRAADDEPDAQPFLTRAEMLDVVDLVSARVMHKFDLDNPVSAMSILMSEPALTDRWVRFGVRYGGSAPLGSVVVDAVQDAVRDVLIREVEAIFEEEMMALSESDIAASLSATMAWLEEYARTSDVADGALVALDGALRRAQGQPTEALANAIQQAAEALREAGNDAIARQLTGLGEKTAARVRSLPLLMR